MGLFDDFFSGDSSQSSGGLFDSLFGDGSTEPESSGSLFGGWAPPTPSAGTHRGYGDQPYLTHSDADKSHLMSGIVRDPATGYVGTPSEIYDRYVADGRNPDSLIRRFHR